MINFFSLPEYCQYLVVLLNLLIMIVNIYCIVVGHIFKAKKQYRIADIILFVFATVSFFILCGGNFGYRRGSTRYGFFVDLCERTSPLIMLLLLLLAGASIYSLYMMNRWRKSYITPASIKEGMDKLPAGLCYHNEKGVPTLINHRMDNLCRFLIDEPLFDANEFWQKLISGNIQPGNTVIKSGSNPIIHLMGGNTVSFTKIETEIGGRKTYEIRATDITKQYALNLELQKYNNEMRSINRRLQEYGENVWDITREREVLSAKVSIHDWLGKSLLVTKRYIENGPVDISEKELIEMWKANVALFNGGALKREEENSLDELYGAAKIMGIRLKVEGEVPKDKQILRFVMSGARECLTNAVHHAGASELTISLCYRYGFCVIEYTNDGAQPNEPISEGGGLSSLRQRVESEGGIMETDILPRFVLRLKIPSKEALK